MSSHSYLAGSWVLICPILVGSVGSIPTTLVSSSGRKAIEALVCCSLGLLGSKTPQAAGARMS